MYQHITAQKANENLQRGLNNVQLAICGHYTNVKDHFIARDGIDEYVLIYCVAGTGFLKLRERSLEIRSGELFLLDRQVYHEYGSSQKDPWSIWWMHLSGDMDPLYRLFEEKNTSCVCQLGYNGRIQRLFEEMLPLVESRSGVLDNLKANENARLILLEVLSQRPDHENDLMERIKAYLCTHMTERLTLDGLSRQFSLSKYHMVRRFKKDTGYTPIEFLTRQRISAACRQLLETDDTVTEVSRQLGYTTPYYFSEQFKQLTGYSPASFRRLMKSFHL